MTTCDEITFERLIAHIEEPDDDGEARRHIARCGRCALRATALRLQTLALLSLARRQRRHSAIESPWPGDGAVDDGPTSRGQRVEQPLGGVGGRGPGACLGAARDAGLTCCVEALRRLFLACLEGAAPGRPLRGNALEPSPIEELVAEVTSLARRLSGLGLSVKVDGLCPRPTSRRQHLDQAALLLARLTDLEGSRPWVTAARDALARAQRHA